MVFSIWPRPEVPGAAEEAVTPRHAVRLEALGESRLGVQGWTSLWEDDENRVQGLDRLPGERRGRKGHKPVLERIFTARGGQERGWGSAHGGRGGTR